MKTQMEIFTKEFYRCARCFIMYCEDNLNDDGSLDELTIAEALEGFQAHIAIAYKSSKGEMNYEG